MNESRFVVQLGAATGNFQEATLLASLVAMEALVRDFHVSQRLLRDVLLGGWEVDRRHLKRLLDRLVTTGLITKRVHPNTRTTIRVLPDALGYLLDAGAELVPKLDEDRLMVVMHALENYDDAVLLCHLMVIAPGGETSVADLVPQVPSMDRFRAHRVLKRLASRGLVVLESRPRSGTRIVLVAASVEQLLLKPLPNVRYLKPGVFDSMPFFVERVKRIAAAQSVVSIDGAQASADAAPTSSLSTEPV